MNKSNVILIGMPASGKSTCGVLAAKLLLKNFYDTDLLLQGVRQMSLQDILDNFGVNTFLEYEEKAIMSLNLEATVIATGGSVIYSEKAMNHIKSLGKVIYLHLSYETMVKRIDNLTTRGVVMKEGNSLLDMYNERLKLYEKYADVTIDCDENTVEETAMKIAKAVED